MSSPRLSGFIWPSGASGMPQVIQSVVSLSSPSQSSVTLSQPGNTFGSGTPPASFSTVYVPTVTSGNGAPSVSFPTSAPPEATVTSGSGAPAVSFPVDPQSSASVQPIGLDPMSQPGIPVNGSSGLRTIRIVVTSTVIVDPPVANMTAVIHEVEQADVTATPLRSPAPDATGGELELNSPVSTQSRVKQESSSKGTAIGIGIAGAVGFVFVLLLLYVTCSK
jgi:hypothetical protein